MPTANLPLAGPVLPDILGQPGAQQAISPTLDSVAALISPSPSPGPPTLLDLRRLRLEALIRSDARPWTVTERAFRCAAGLSPSSIRTAQALQAALNAGFRLASDERDPILGMRVVSLAVPAGLSARNGLKRLRRIAPELQADFDHLFEPAGGRPRADRGGRARRDRDAGSGPPSA